MKAKQRRGRGYLGIGIDLNDICTYVGISGTSCNEWVNKQTNQTCVCWVRRENKMDGKNMDRPHVSCRL